jgi:hypothetical protein
VNATEAIQCFIEGRLSEWPGLPLLTIAALSEILGTPVHRESAPLGASTALRHTFELRDRTAAVFAFERDAHVVMIEISPPPGHNALEKLPEPTTVLPQEIRIEGAYAHEYFYAERGMLLTVAQSLEEPGRVWLVRCRGIRAVPATTRTPEPDLFAPLATRVRW